jgi:hypothetical protein
MSRLTRISGSFLQVVEMQDATSSEMPPVLGLLESAPEGLNAAEASTRPSIPVIVCL